MAANGTHHAVSPALQERVEEEIARAERHGVRLSCLVVVVPDAERLKRKYGPALFEQALAYVGLALRRELRRFDRVRRVSEHEHLLVLPGADGARCEAVARRVLGRLRAIKLEAHGERDGLGACAGMATWSAGVTASELIAAALATTSRQAAAWRIDEPASTSGLPAGPLGFS